MIEPTSKRFGEDAAEQARGNTDQPGCGQADVLSAGEDESPECPDDQAGEHEPEEREGQADEGAREQQGQDDDDQDDDDRHVAQASERRQVADALRFESGSPHLAP